MKKDTIYCPFEYAVLRYTHNQFVGEFMNVGVLLIEKDTNKLTFQHIEKQENMNRFTTFFPDADVNFVYMTIKALKEKVKNIKLKRRADLNQIANTWVLADDDSALRFSKAIMSLGNDRPEKELQTLCEIYLRE